MSIGKGTRFGRFGLTGDRCILRNARPSMSSWFATSFLLGRFAYIARSVSTSAIIVGVVQRLSRATRRYGRIARRCAFNRAILAGELLYGRGISTAYNILIRRRFDCDRRSVNPII
jgi:hypothetical protein